jgi:hypothetical protein
MARMGLVARTEDPGTDDWKAARAWIVKANHADGKDPLPYVQYFRSFAEAGERPPPVALDGLQRALELAPQDQGLRITFALQLAYLGKFDTAASVIRPIAYDPHNGAASKDAQRFLAAFEQKKMPDFSSPAPAEAAAASH